MLVWWHVHRHGGFYVIGLDEPWATLLGPALPAISAGLIVALALSLVDAVAGPLAGVVAAVVVMALPGFLPLHVDSLSGPPLAALAMMMLGVMLQAPRFSVAYGALAAIATVFIDPAGLGLPLAAIAWAVVVRRPDGNGIWPRVGFALLPLAVAIALARWVGGSWPDVGVLGWRGRLDEGLQAAGTVIGDQLAPALGGGALRWFAIADVTLILLALVVMAWRRSAPGSMPRRFLLAATLLVAALVAGHSLRWLWLPDSPPPGIVGVFPVVVFLAMSSVAAAATLWPRWPRWGRALAVVLAVGWLQAALRA